MGRMECWAAEFGGFCLGCKMGGRGHCVTRVMFMNVWSGCRTSEVSGRRFSVGDVVSPL